MTPIESIIIAGAFLLPFALSLITFGLLRLSRETKLDAKLTVGMVTQWLFKRRFTLRQLAYLILAIGPVIYLWRVFDTLFGPLTRYVYLLPWIAVWVALLVARMVKIPSATNDETTLMIGQLTATANDSRSALEKLSALLEVRQAELTQSEANVAQVVSKIATLRTEANALGSLTDEQQALVLKIMKRSQTPSLLSRFGFVFVTIALNIAATVLWTLLGSPGQKELLNGISKLLP